jgi:hypothetical protein
MNKYAELEIGLHRRDAGSYSVDFRFSQPESEADVRLAQSQSTQVTFDFDQLKEIAHDAESYGAKLTHDFFADPAVSNAFSQARTSAQSLDYPLRLRLLIGPSAPELHSLRWETLRDPQDDTPLCTTENLLFSRYLSSLDWRPVRLRPQGELKALALIANPSDLGDYKLAAVDVDGELERARAALSDIPLTSLPDQEGDQ